MTKEEEIQRGIEAQHFLQFIDREPYFRKLFEELDKEYTKEILGLKPADTEKFTLLQTKRLALYEPIDRAKMDVVVGENAKANLDKPQGKGIV